MSQSLASRLTRAPIPFDPARAADVTAKLPDALATGPMAELTHGTAGSSPYLARLLERHGDWLADRAGDDPATTMAALCTETRETAESADWRVLCSGLRTAKTRAALLIALADLGGAWDLAAVTHALSDLADTLTDAAVRWLLAKEIERGKLPGMTAASLATGAAFTVIAMGKHGARELNYSSDIDLICLFDQDQLDPDDFGEAKARYIHVTRQLVKALADQTAEGYVFRTDLRLRPSPSTTPVAMAMEPAERYYESVGRTWERAAHIKARPVAGDIAAGRAYLDRLSPFIWRRYLDFAAIEDAERMLRMIREKKGAFHPSTVPGHDIKLGPGGIREIEFFAQTRQLIMGGRLPGLRVPTTLGALAALRKAAIIPAAMEETLARAYVAHRTLEHRLQMVEDAQTQTIPTGAEARARVAALDGWSDPAAWEADIAERLKTVHGVTESFFDASRRKPHDPEGAALDEEALAARGFTRTEDACRVIRRWRSGGIAATRSERARGLYMALEADLIDMLGHAGNPDDAIAEFDRFISGLPAGVQVFSLFKANRHLLDLVVGTCAAAPRLAAHLGREPQTLDALLGADFFDKLPPRETLGEDLAQWLARAGDYEAALDTTRRWAREVKFRAGVQVLKGLADEVEAGAAFSAIADAALAGLYPRVVEDFASRHGPPPGRGMAVIAMGKLGTGEMTAGSDLDLITVYDADGVETSDGPRPLPPATYYPRLTQSLLSALTAPTAEGRLYEVDMRLRPSGRQGPVAVSLAAFDRYQHENAWAWEHLALTRARVSCGPEDLAPDVEAIIASALARRRGDEGLMNEIVEMRIKLIEAHRKDRDNPWSFKHAAGGLMEIEFIAQTGALLHGLGAARPARETLAALGEIGWITTGEADTLRTALRLQSRMQQVERVALETPFDPETAGIGLREAMSRAAGAEDFDALAARLAEAQSAAAAVAERVFTL